MITALMLIGFQNDHFPNGRAPLEHSKQASQHAEAALNTAREHNMAVYHIQQISTHPNAQYFLPCTKGTEFWAELAPLSREIIIKKHYPNAFKDTALFSQLQKKHIRHIVIAGMTTQLDIDATVRAARDHGFTCSVLYDACAAMEVRFQHQVIPAHEVNAAFLGALFPNYATLISTTEFVKQLSQPVAMTA